MEWESYDPTWLVQLATEQHREVTWLPEALSKCTKCIRESEAYIYFVDPSNPNEPESEWRYMESVVLESETEGPINIDILKGNRVGGAEFEAKISED